MNGGIVCFTRQQVAALRKLLRARKENTAQELGLVNERFKRFQCFNLEAQSNVVPSLIQAGDLFITVQNS